MPKSYISGKISGMEEEAKRIFEEAADYLKAQGYEVVNPFEVTQDMPENSSWEDYMKANIKALMDCDCIFMLKNWTQSPGAYLEHWLAIQLDIKIFYQ